MSGSQQNIKRINVDWDYNVHVIDYDVRSYRLPNNALIIIQLSDEYVLIDTSDNGDFMERFETFEELNEYLRKYYGIELNEPE